MFYSQNFLPVSKWEILDAIIGHTFGDLELPFTAYKVKIGSIQFNDNPETTDIIRWMTERQYNNFQNNNIIII